MKTYIAIGHTAGSSKEDIRSIAFAANRKSSFRSSCVDNGFTPYIILTESTMQKIRDCRGAMDLYDIVKGLTSNYRVWNLCCEYIEEGMGIIEKRLADAKAEEEARMAAEAAAEAVETEITEDTNTINTTEEENTMTTIINDNTNANLTATTAVSYDLHYIANGKVETESFKFWSDAEDRRCDLLRSAPIETWIDARWFVNGEEVGESTWREIREAQREDRSNRKTAEELGKPYMVSYDELDSWSCSFYATAEERDARAADLASRKGVYEIHTRDYTAEEAAEAPQQEEEDTEDNQEASSEEPTEETAETFDLTVTASELGLLAAGISNILTRYETDIKNTRDPQGMEHQVKLWKQLKAKLAAQSSAQVLAKIA